MQNQKTHVPSTGHNRHTVAAIQAALDKQFERTVATVSREKHSIIVEMADGQEERHNYVVAFVGGFLAARGL